LEFHFHTTHEQPSRSLCPQTRYPGSDDQPNGSGQRRVRTIYDRSARGRHLQVREAFGNGVRSDRSIGGNSMDRSFRRRTARTHPATDRLSHACRMSRDKRACKRAIVKASSRLLKLQRLWYDRQPVKQRPVNNHIGQLRRRNLLKEVDRRNNQTRAAHAPTAAADRRM
jgi:hypothetical protein